MVNNDMHGKVCLITGTTAGIGKVAAMKLAQMGATVLMLCRNRAKGEAVQAEIKHANPQSQVDLIVADLNSLADVRRVADEFQQRYSQLHILINNAGAIHSGRITTADGLESTFAANYLAPFLLTELLLDVLKASAPARIINVSSSGHLSGSIDFDDLQGARRYGFLKAYNQSKLAQIYSTYELADRLQGTDVTVNALHPGLVNSNFNSGTKGIAHYIGVVIYRLTGISEEKGAQTILDLATSPEYEKVSGKYFSEGKETRSSDLSYDVGIRQRLWNVSQDLIRQNAPSDAMPMR